MPGWTHLSIAKKLSLVVGVMAVLIAGELLTLRFSMRILSAVRAFVGGEGAWSKAQKDATLSLQRYAVTHDERDYQEFLAYLKVPEGDQLARKELQKPKPDLEKVRPGFIQGRIHPDDIEPIVYLLKNFYWISYVERAIQRWTRGDELLDELKNAGESYRKALNAGHPDQKTIRDVTDRIRTINQEVSTLEEDFSNTLGEGSRWLEHIVLTLLFMAVLTVEAIGLTLTFRITRRISRGLSDLNQAAKKMGQGDFSVELDGRSEDDIGTLTASLSQMGTLLQRSYKTLEKRVDERTLELSRLASENARLYEETKAALHTRDEFLSIASHELKTPLSGIFLQLQLMERLLPTLPPSESTDRHKRNLESAIKQAKRLTILIEELLDLTRIRAGKLELLREACDLMPLLDDSLKQLHPDITKSGSTIAIGGDIAVNGNFDPIRMTQVITNLVSNAVKYGRGKPIEVELRVLNGHAEICVKDQGHGIPDEKLPHIFEPFERATTDVGISGLGLGLYITRQILHAHGGSIAVQSRHGEGSLFIARIPVKITATA